ncbi:hypothetical protein B0H14DRAFT_3598733 [Mycena olivaceomarginata]|nr:hypothetical protein B0H14DRAFT_3598733 [Mycena olivaceomarginata]
MATGRFSHNLQRLGGRPRQLFPVDETTGITPHERRMLEAMNSSSSEHFQYIRQNGCLVAKEFEDALNAGDVATQRQIRLSVGTTPCLSASRDKWTQRVVTSPTLRPQLHAPILEPVPDSRLEAHIGRSKQPGAYHKDWCKVIRPIPLGPPRARRNLLEQFLQARFDVLDSDYRKAGFWAIPERINPHDISDDPLFSSAAQPFMQFKDNTNLKGYAHGALMLELEEWPSDVEGWKLQEEALIPHIFFTGQFPPPVRPRPDQVKDWKSWYDWRGLSSSLPRRSSWIRVDDLLPPHGDAQGSTFADVEREAGSGRSLSRSGDRVELPPAFSELALLLPNTPYQPYHFLTRHARSPEARLSSATRAPSPRARGRSGSTPPPNYRRRLHRGIALPRAPTYRRMPASCGHSKACGSALSLCSPPKDPDALVALNAGILSYSTWREVVSCATMAKHPLRMHGLFPAECPDVRGPHPRVVERSLSEFFARGEHTSGAGEAADAPGGS